LVSSNDNTADGVCCEKIGNVKEEKVGDMTLFAIDIESPSEVWTLYSTDKE
jgi:hypothetical protein